MTSTRAGKLEKADIRFEVLEGASEKSSTYVFGDEDHTLGNCLRHLLMQECVLRLVTGGVGFVAFL